MSVFIFPILKGYMFFCIFVQTDRAAMLDEIVDYVKFLRLQVKVKYISNLCQSGWFVYTFDKIINSLSVY